MPALECCLAITIDWVIVFTPLPPPPDHEQSMAMNSSTARSVLQFAVAPVLYH